MTESRQFVTVVPVRWSDFDQFNHVNNVAYFEFAQEARVAFVTEGLGRALSAHATVVRRIEIDYLRALLPDTKQVTVETEIINVGTTSYTLSQSIKDQHGHVTAVVKTIMVLFDLERSVALQITAAERQQLTQFTSPELTAGE